MSDPKNDEELSPALALGAALRRTERAYRWLDLAPLPLTTEFAHILVLMRDFDARLKMLEQ